MTCYDRLNKAERLAAQQLELYNYCTNGPPEKPVYDVTADAAAAVQQLLQGDVVITTYDVLQQVGACQMPAAVALASCCWESISVPV
jgi:hypothetical protein